MIINKRKLQIVREFVRLYLNKIETNEPLFWIHNKINFQMFNSEDGSFTKMSPFGIGFDIYDILDTNIESFFDKIPQTAANKGITIIRAFQGDSYKTLISHFSSSKTFFLESLSYFMNDLWHLL